MYLKLLPIALLSIASSFAVAQPISAESNQSQSTSSNSTALGGAGGSATGGSASANNAGNTQVINFNSPEVSTSNVNQTVSGTTTQNQNVNQTVSGTTTQNVNSNQTVNGTQTVNNVSSGGTNSTVRTIAEGTSKQIVEYQGTQTIKNVPSMGAPQLTTSNDTCMGSSSGSVAAPGIGVSLGSTWTDDNCLRLKNARELWNMGARAGALALLCTDDKVRVALEDSANSPDDYVCPATKRARQQAQAQADAAARQANLAESPRSTVAANDASWANANLNDPIIARRAGLR